jgi:hypothetical protein
MKRVKNLKTGFLGRYCSHVGTPSVNAVSAQLLYQIVISEKQNEKIIARKIKRFLEKRSEDVRISK